jgi:transposase
MFTPSSFSRKQEDMTPTRYVGLDIHKRQVTIAAVNAQQEVVLTPQKILIQDFAPWVQKHLRPDDSVALEATTNAWEFHDQLFGKVAEVSVAHSSKIKLISASASKTDKQDALVLAKLLAAHLLPTVWVPPQPVRELRLLTQHRAQLVSQRNALKNQLHGLLHRHNLKLPKEGSPFIAAQENWWSSLPLTPCEHLQVRHFWLTLHHLSTLIEETETQIAQLSVNETWNESLTHLIQIPGVGLYSGMTILAAIGKIARFPSAQQLVGYAGLGARVHDSADTHRGGKISKQGRRELRTALIVSAWSAVRWSLYWRIQFQSLAKRIGKYKAITAIARKLLVTIWHVLTKRQPDRHADPQAVARSLMTWASLHHLAHSLGLHRLVFVRQRLEVLGLLDRVSAFRANGRSHFLVPT